MVQRGSGAGFLKEPAAAILLCNVLRWEYLEGHHALEFVVEGFVDSAHAAGANRFDDPVVGDGFDGEGLHGAYGIDYTDAFPNKNQGRRIIVSFSNLKTGAAYAVSALFFKSRG